MALPPTPRDSETDRKSNEAAIFPLAVAQLSTASTPVAEYTTVFDARLDDTYAFDEFPDLEESTWKDFFERCSENTRIRDEYDTQLVFAEYSEINRIDADYHDRAEGRSYIRLSRVGFNPEMDQAIIYADQYCGNLCGQGFLILFKLEADGWKPTDMIMVWVS